MNFKISVPWCLLTSLGLLLTGCSSNSSAQSVYNNASLKGSYALSFAVAVGSSNGSISYTGGNGVMVADGNGNLSGSESYTDTEGDVCSNLALSGTYTINPNGTGLAVFKYGTNNSDANCQGSLTQALVIAQGGELVKTSNLNANVAQLSGEWTRQ
ncbi:MAG TPA: hypothetical protein VKV28_05140 [Candidatus Binataceae bacterium]|nr:hypothetical protein [Candidatus Binataceae bacterium]